MDNNESRVVYVSGKENSKNISIPTTIEEVRENTLALLVLSGSSGSSYLFPILSSFLYL